MGTSMSQRLLGQLQHIRGEIRIRAMGGCQARSNFCRGLVTLAPFDDLAKVAQGKADAALFSLEHLDIVGWGER